jgi:hypothetical protein
MDLHYCYKVITHPQVCFRQFERSCNGDRLHDSDEGCNDAFHILDGHNHRSDNDELKRVVGDDGTRGVHDHSLRGIHGNDVDYKLDARTDVGKSYGYVNQHHHMEI